MRVRDSLLLSKVKRYIHVYTHTYTWVYTKEEGGAHVAPTCALVVGYTEGTNVHINAHVIFKLHVYLKLHLNSFVFHFQLLKLEALSESSADCASASPCAAAFVYHSRAWFTSLVTPRPFS